MRVCRAPARDALAAPSSFVQLLNQLFFKWERAAGRLAPVCCRVVFTTAVVAEYSTALSRLGQHLFFNRQHHARPQKPGGRVVDADRKQRPALVKDADVAAVLERLRAARGHRRAVTRAARVLGR